MPIPVNPDDVNDVLKPWLGTLFLMSTPLSREIAYEIMRYAPARETFAQLRDRLEHQMLMSINKLTRSSMCIMVEDYRTKRLTLGEIEDMTDDLIGIVFDRLSPFSSNFERLNAYALQHASLSALRVLYQKYASFYSEEEYVFMVKMIKKTYPRERYQAWLQD